MVLVQAKWYYYILLGLVDVEAKFLGRSNPRIGDILVIAGASLYAVSNVSEINGSTMLNLSLLTSDMLIGCTVAFGAVVVGLIIYSGGDGDENQDPHHVAFGLLGFGQISSFTPS
ncbi:hypothetical protein JHK82_057378 [Glycine max]|nr:hypothetical protein JHK86_057211 [Glycine max]KAG4919955.1 hypothetical protein JHK85_058236 [Glycine max]KAG5076038.1 hypothetical protein JHK84_057269 [Glycine max]KAG5078683.1 hypothetical protein JHK82_057378 [Glycine max]